MAVGRCIHLEINYNLCYKRHAVLESLKVDASLTFFPFEKDLENLE